jgi:2-hydroxy-6-oxonona-2,4-dienedioate hydrolase
MRQAAATRPGAMEAFSASEKSIAAVRSNPVLFTDFDMRDSLPALAKVIPTVFVWGESDIFAPPELGRKVEGMLPDIKFHWIPNAGHQAQTDQPEKVATIVDDLVRSATKTPSAV